MPVFPEAHTSSRIALYPPGCLVEHRRQRTVELAYIRCSCARRVTRPRRDAGLDHEVRGKLLRVEPQDKKARQCRHALGCQHARSEQNLMIVEPAQAGRRRSASLAVVGEQYRIEFVDRRIGLRLAVEPWVVTVGNQRLRLKLGHLVVAVICPEVRLTCVPHASGFQRGRRLGDDRHDQMCSIDDTVRDLDGYRWVDIASRERRQARLRRSHVIDRRGREGPVLVQA